MTSEDTSEKTKKQCRFTRSGWLVYFCFWTACWDWMCVWNRELPASCHPDSTSTYSDQPSFFWGGGALAVPPLSCPTQWGRILLVAMTPGQCLYEMQPLTVWTAGQDRDTSRFKEKLLSGTAGRGRQTPSSLSNPDPVSWNGTFSRPNEVQRESLDGGITWQCCSCHSAFSDWFGIISPHGEEGVDVCVSQWRWKEKEEARSWESAAAGSRMGCDPWIQLKD